MQDNVQGTLLVQHVPEFQVQTDPVTVTRSLYM